MKFFLILLSYDFPHFLKFTGSVAENPYLVDHPNLDLVLLILDQALLQLLEDHPKSLGHHDFDVLIDGSHEVEEKMGDAVVAELCRENG